MAVALCPSCEGQITVRGNAQIGDSVRCPHCYEDLEVIETQPIELDWSYDEDEDDWYNDEDDDWEYEEDEDNDDDY